ncbi:MAG: AAA family ATPase [Acidimicrobiales bacterium]
MIDPTICDRCGELDRSLTRAPGPVTALRCGHCHADRPFRCLPLLCLTGPSGVGKSTVAAAVARLLHQRVITLEQDVLWEPRLAHQTGGVRAFRARWLRLAAMIGQNGRPVLLCGTVVPEELEPLPERALFSAIHYLALDAADEVLANRLRARPAWRGWDEDRIEEMLRFARDLRRRAGDASRPAETLHGLATDGRQLEVVAQDVVRWVLPLALEAAPDAS